MLSSGLLRMTAMAAILAASSTFAHARGFNPLNALTDDPAEPEPAEIDPAVATGVHWRLMTDRGPVHVWTPANYDRETAITVVFVHGYNTDVDNAWTDYRLPEQFARSGVNAMFIACGAPSASNRPMVWASLSGLLATVKAGIAQPLPWGQVVAVGHSAAYRTLVLWLPNPALRTLVLLDAAYGELDQFQRWARDETYHRLINVASDTIPDSNLMHAFLPGTRRVDGLPANGWPDDVRTSRLLYVRTTVGHMPMITGGIALPLVLRALPSSAVHP